MLLIALEYAVGPFLCCVAVVAVKNGIYKIPQKALIFIYYI